MFTKMKMKIKTQSGYASTLENKIFRMANQNELQTWSVMKTSENEDVLVHSEQWRHEGLVKLASNGNEMSCHILCWQNHTKSCNDIIPYLTGRFTEILLKYFEDEIDSFEIID